MMDKGQRTANNEQRPMDDGALGILLSLVGSMMMGRTGHRLLLAGHPPWELHPARHDVLDFLILLRHVQGPILHHGYHRSVCAVTPLSLPLPKNASIWAYHQRTPQFILLICLLYACGLFIYQEH